MLSCETFVNIIIVTHTKHSTSFFTSMIDVFVFRNSELELRIIIINLPTDWPQIIHPAARTKKKKKISLCLN